MVFLSNVLTKTTVLAVVRPLFGFWFDRGC